MQDGLSLSLDLAEARNLIVAQAHKKRGELIPLDQAIGRVPVDKLPALISEPGFDQSTRDGFVISGGGGEREENGCWYEIAGEIPAGSTQEITLSHGVACRIMTGGLLPEKGVRVLPQEGCLEKSGKVFIPNSLMQHASVFIRRKGCDIDKGDVLAVPGKPMSLDQIALLAKTGYTELKVHQRPSVSYFCSGSELVSLPSEVEEGKKISANCYLLEGMIRSFGGLPENLGPVADSFEAVSKVFHDINPDRTDVVISTGGMGPGKYDLIEEAFLQNGGKLLYRSLKVRPGKATLFGLFGRTLFLGLPGPPPVVRSLGNELLRPALLSFQGVEECHPVTIRAYLQEPFSLKKRGVQTLKAGILTLKDGKCNVRACAKRQIPTVFMLLQADRQHYEEGELIEVHLVTTPFL